MYKKHVQLFCRCVTHFEMAHMRGKCMNVYLKLLIFVNSNIVIDLHDLPIS